MTTSHSRLDAAKRRWRKRQAGPRAKSRASLVALVVASVLTVGGVAVALDDWREDVSTTLQASDLRTLERPKPEDLTILGGTKTLERPRQMIAADKPLVLSVLGDSTGNAGDEWVYLYAKHLAETRAVTYHGWDDIARRWLPPETLSTIGAATDIWNMGAPGKASDYPADSIGLMQPKRPDLMLYSFGHNNTADDFTGGLYGTLLAMKKQWGRVIPTVLVLQNPSRRVDLQDRQERTVSHIRNNTVPAYGMVAIDVFSAFEKTGEVEQLLREDQLHPNEAGSRLWADTVIGALG